MAIITAIKGLTQKGLPKETSIGFWLAHASLLIGVCSLDSAYRALEVTHSCSWLCPLVISSNHWNPPKKAWQGCFLPLQLMHPRSPMQNPNVDELVCVNPAIGESADLHSLIISLRAFTSSILSFFYYACQH